MTRLEETFNIVRLEKECQLLFQEIPKKNHQFVNNLYFTNELFSSKNKLTTFRQTCLFCSRFWSLKFHETVYAIDSLNALVPMMNEPLTFHNLKENDVQASVGFTVHHSLYDRLCKQHFGPTTKRLLLAETKFGFAVGNAMRYDGFTSIPFTFCYVKDSKMLTRMTNTSVINSESTNSEGATLILEHVDFDYTLDEFLNLSVESIDILGVMIQIVGTLKNLHLEHKTSHNNLLSSNIVVKKLFSPIRVVYDCQLLIETTWVVRVLNFEHSIVHGSFPQSEFDPFKRDRQFLFKIVSNIGLLKNSVHGCCNLTLLLGRLTSMFQGQSGTLYCSREHSKHSEILCCIKPFLTIRKDMDNKKDLIYNIIAYKQFICSHSIQPDDWSEIVKSYFQKLKLLWEAEADWNKKLHIGTFANEIFKMIVSSIDRQDIVCLRLHKVDDVLDRVSIF